MKLIRYVIFATAVLLAHTALQAQNTPPAGQKVVKALDVSLKPASSELDAESLRKLDAWVGSLAGIQLEVIIAVGHSDLSDGDANGLPLSQQRANAVKAYLSKQGIPGDRIYIEGKGSSQPAGYGAANRRVEIEAIGTRDEKLLPVDPLFKTRQAAATGDAVAMWRLGQNYSNGEGVATDKTEAVSWYRQAAAAGNINGMNYLAYHLQTGIGVTKDLPEAVIWYSKAANAGSADAMVRLGHIYSNGEGLATDKTAAVSWYRKAAAAGNVAAMTNLAYHLQTGIGVTKDLPEAVIWYSKAANAGSADAMVRLGHIYSNGEGLATDKTAAVSWYRKAAAAGNVTAMTNFGYHLQSGIGVTKNLPEAIGWYRIAAIKGEPTAIRNLQIALTEQAAANAPPPAARVQAAPAAPAAPAESSAGNDFMGAMLGGLASSMLQRNAALLNSAAASTGGGAGAALGALAGVTNKLASETREQLGRNAGADSVAGRLGGTVGSALGGGNAAGALATANPFNGPTGLGGALLSGITGSAPGASAKVPAAGDGSGSRSGCCSSPAERLADNRSRGAPDNFETTNERICRTTGQRAYCEGGVTERRLNLGGLEKYGPSAGGDPGSTTLQTLRQAGAVVGSCSTAASLSFEDKLQNEFNTYKNDGQCGPIVQAAEALRLQAVANCRAGDVKSADLIYGGQYLRQMVPYVKSACPS